jgi:RNA polymerase sigma factor (sigma-70 family)
MKSSAVGFLEASPTPVVLTIPQGSRRQRVLTARDALVVAHLPLVRQIALRVSQSLPPSFDLDDLEAEGRLALIRCATRFQPDAHGNPPFSAYARQRIRGAMLDSVRRGRYAENTRPSIDELPEAGLAPTVEIRIDQARTKKRVREAISWLPAEQRDLIVARYLEERRVTPSLNSETHVVAIDALRRRLKAA